MNLKTERFEMRLDPATVERVDAWRGSETDLPSRSEAVRRLVEVGLSRSTRNAVRITDGEKLSLLLLCDLYEKGVVNGDFEPDFVREVIYGGHYWALSWKYPGVFHSHVDDQRNVSEVADILDMWSFLEGGFAGLEAEDRQKLEAADVLFGDSLSFPGFDGNNESEHGSIAQFLIERLGRFSRFKARSSLNSHMPCLAGYRRMLEVFLPIRTNLIGRGLDVDQIIEIMAARTHPSRRKPI